MIDRRLLLAGATVLVGGVVEARSRPGMVLFRDPQCGCCSAWVDHVLAAGITVDVGLETAMDRIKTRFAVPDDLVSCHTAVVGGYVIEGHVPAPVILKLLRERPVLTGIAVAGMPVGSPGMEAPGLAAEPFGVVGFGPTGARSIYADFPRGFLQ